ncbi:hypothetical protein DYB32_009909 [Aphanomyces invadans]|uniref:Peptidase S1 domain-containing protein n=1 Tax=Aphanomyces invadans TaxID=157072 RepID=A0A418AGY2_9STRA|nr:hypothetical protein DYB32_009909 [Aphanomyces invadans]
MAKFLALVALTAASAVAQFEIVNGTEAPVGKYTYVTGIRETETGRTICGASLIAPKVLLTAARCAGEWANYASVGSHYTSGSTDGERIKIVKKTLHPKYSEFSDEYDIAIFELESESKVPPVALNWVEDDATAPGTVAWVRGFGETTKTSSEGQSPYLLETDVKIWTNEDCHKVMIFEIFPFQVCAGGDGKGFATNDVGGPLTVIRNGVEYVAGVAVWGHRGSWARLPGVYMRVSSFRDFIEPFLPVTPTTTKPAC